MVFANSNPQLDNALAILGRDPRNVGAHMQAGVLYSQDNKWDKSAYHLKKALAGDKNNALILEKLGDVLVNTRQPADALKYARKLVGKNKHSASGSFLMAKTYFAIDDAKKAIHWIDLALKQDPENLEMLGRKAKYHSATGEIDQALGILQQILEQDPLSPNSWFEMAQLQKYDKDKGTEALKKIEAAIAQQSSKEDLRELHFAAGKIQQDIGNYSQAFEHFKTANILHDHPILAKRIVASKLNFFDTYSKEFFSSRKEQGDHSTRPIFILGQTRSGTTLTESLCAAHSKISAGGELIHLKDYNDKLEADSLIRYTHPKNIQGLSRRDIEELAKDYNAKSKRLRAPGTRLTDKMPHNFIHIGLIALMFPNAQIIHCRRHPLDNCLSIFSNPMLDYHKEYKSTLDVLGEYYDNYVQIMNFWKEVCPIPIHDVFYEDLVTNTEAVARRMIDHLGLEWEDGVMDRTGSQKAVKTLSVWQVRQPVFQSSKGKWRNYEKELEPLAQILEPYIKDYEAELKALDGGNDNAQ